MYRKDQNANTSNDACYIATPFDNNKKSNTPSDNNEAARADQFENIIKSGSVVTKKSGGSIHFLTIIGQIEGHYALGDGQKATKYEHLIPLLAAIEESEEIDGMLVILNTMGGDVEAGLALAELIASMKKPSVSLVLGGGHSIGVPLAVATDYSFIVPSATMTLHPVRTTGMILGVPQTFNYFKRMQKRITNFISSHSNIHEDRLTEIMMKTNEIATDMGSVIDGKEAVSEGIINEIGGLSSSLLKLRDLIAQSKSGSDSDNTAE